MLSSLFKEVELFHAKSVTLTLMYEEEEIDTAATLNFDPMEIKAYQVKLKWGMSACDFKNVSKPPDRSV